MANAAGALISMKKEKDFLICIDSDGCAFDTMEVKHKECFCPATVNRWGLQAISKYAREAAEYVNLYSKSRGINRFPALIEVIDLLSDRDEVKKRKFTLPNVDPIREWISLESKLGNPQLIEYVKNHPDDAVMRRALDWSLEVNENVAKIVRDVPPFPYVRESLEMMGKFADVIVVSATPNEALIREWEEHDIAGFTKVIAGQEMGSKKECIGYAMDKRYDPSRVLMIGDAPGDLKAARGNGALFFPINPGDEDASWQKFYEESCAVFRASRYAGDYEQKLIERFDSYLPSTPPWKR